MGNMKKIDWKSLADDLRHFPPTAIFALAMWIWPGIELGRGHGLIVAGAALGIEILGLAILLALFSKMMR
jgi:hypothetical protein